jgi:prevent-host-death family protein
MAFSAFLAPSGLPTENMTIVSDHEYIQMPASTIPAGEFKAHCLQLLDEVAASHAPLTITKRGRPVAQLVPVPAERPLFGALQGSVLAQQDLIAPVGEAWEAAR